RCAADGPTPEAVSQVEVAPLDESQIGELVATIGAEAFVELANMALADIPGSIASVGEALTAGDIEGARDETHNLTSTLGSYGMRAAYLAAEELEIACRENRSEVARELFGKVDAMSQDARTALERYIDAQRASVA
ncbi:MAG: Hpt domain-containing protein, partial [Alphaproteobacteria bacterium]